MVTAVMPFGPSSSSNPSAPSVTNATGDVVMTGAASAYPSKPGSISASTTTTDIFIMVRTPS